MNLTDAILFFIVGFGATVIVGATILGVFAIVQPNNVITKSANEIYCENHNGVYYYATPGGVICIKKDSLINMNQ